LSVRTEEYKVHGKGSRQAVENLPLSRFALEYPSPCTRIIRRITPSALRDRLYPVLRVFFFTEPYRRKRPPFSSHPIYIHTGSPLHTRSSNGTRCCTSRYGLTSILHTRQDINISEKVRCAYQDREGDRKNVRDGVTQIVKNSYSICICVCMYRIRIRQRDFSARPSMYRRMDMGI
jgi:hypothetical protein